MKNPSKTQTATPSTAVANARKTMSRRVLPVFMAGLTAVAFASTSHALGHQGTSAQGVSRVLSDVASRRAATNETLTNAEDNTRGAEQATTWGTPPGASWSDGEFVDEFFTGFKPADDGSGWTVITVVRLTGQFVEAFVTRPSGAVMRARLHPRDLVGVEFLAPRCEADGTCITLRYRVASVTRARSRTATPGHGGQPEVWRYDLQTTDASARQDAVWRDVRPAPLSQDHGQASSPVIGDGPGDAGSDCRTAPCRGALIARQ